MADISRLRPLIIQVAPTGMIPQKSDNPSVPITPEEIALNVTRCYALGASVVHVHARYHDGKPAFEREIYQDIFERIRENCPGIIICASTSGREFSDVGKRSQVLELRPEMATLSMGSVNFVTNPSSNPLETIRELAGMMKERGIKPELEIFEPGFINTALYLVKEGILKPPLHFNLLLGSLGSIPAGVKDLVYLVESIPAGNTWSATGIGRYQIGINTLAIVSGGHVRVGLEDAIYHHHATREHATNEKLVSRIARIAEEVGRKVATPGEAREILKLDPWP